MSAVVLHIGTFKTGNMSLQLFLRQNQRLLAGHAYRFPVGWLRMNTHLEPHLVFMRPERMSSARIKGDEWRDPRWCASCIGQIARDIGEHSHVTTILSGEHNSLLRFDDELGPLRELLGDAKVIVYLRDRDAWLESLRDELEKYEGLGVSDDPEAFNYVEPDSWLIDYDTRIAKWRDWFTDVRVIDYDQAVREDGGVIPSFMRELGYELDDAKVAEANSIWLNRRGMLDEGRIPGVRWQGKRFGGRDSVGISVYR